MSNSPQKVKQPNFDGILEEDNKKQEFSNPISKTTFEALPRIYGTRKKKKYAIKYQFKPREKDDGFNKQYTPHNCFTAHAKILPNQQQAYQINMDNDNATRRLKTEIRSYDKKYAEQLSIPRKKFCNKRYCFCNQQHHNSGIHRSEPKIRQKIRPIKAISIRLPQLQKVGQLDDIESHHKVSMSWSKRPENEEGSEKSHLTLLDFLRNSQEQSLQPNRSRIKQINSVNHQMLKTSLKKNAQIQHPQKTQNVEVQTELQMNEEYNLKQQQEGSVKGKTQTLESRFSKENQRKIASSASVGRPDCKKEDENNLVEQKESEEPNPRFHLQKLRAKYKEAAQLQSDDDDNKSKRSSISSASISKHVFDSGKKVNTMFHTLTNKQTESVKSSKINKSQDNKKTNQKKPLFQKKNGLFVIPEEDEFVDYLKAYQPMNQKFTIKTLVRKPNFKVVPSADGVFFGELQDQEKNGKGLMVTEREIFQGHYKNDLKNYGCQRNIDGIYKGEFVNGVREGYGTFQWNNGQIFEGQWKNGTKNGFGIWKSPRGDFYEGSWLLNRQHGKGIYKHRLSTYKGEFVEFLKQGQGQQIFSNGDKYVGAYKQGKPHGKGKYEWADGSYYEGDFINGLRHGMGKWVFNNGTVYEGSFENDFKEGKGRQEYKSGQVYVGSFKEGNKYAGTLYDQNKNAIEIVNNQ